MPKLIATRAEHENALEKLLATILYDPSFMEIERIEVSYSGGGDSGDVDEIIFINTSHQPVAELLEAPCTDQIKQAFDIYSPDFFEGTRRSITDYGSLFSGVGLTMLHDHEQGWENNDGGNGKFVFTLDHDFPKIELAWDHTESKGNYRTFEVIADRAAPNAEAA